MKLLFIPLAALSCLLPLNSFASNCFVVSNCVHEVSTCKLTQKVPTYSSFTGIVSRGSQYSYEWVQTIECSHRNGRVTTHVKDGLDRELGSGMEIVKELRIPATIDKVPSQYLDKANQNALDDCEERRSTLLAAYKICK